MASMERPSWLTPKHGIIAGVLVVGMILVVYLNMPSGTAGPPLNPEMTTRDRLARLIAETTSFVVREQRLPSTLQEAANASKTADGWGRDITLTPGSEGSMKTSFVLRSQGGDGQPETPDDWTVAVRFGNDEYGKLGPEKTEIKEPGQ